MGKLFAYLKILVFIGEIGVTVYQCIVEIDEYLRYYTNLSNILIGIAALINVIVLLSHYIKGKPYSYKWLYIVNHVSSCVIFITFIVVVVFLGPIYSYKFVYGGVMFFTHLLLPVMFMVNYFVFCDFYELKLNYQIANILPLWMYAVVYFYNVIIKGVENGGWIDFYQFNKGGYWYITTIVMTIVAVATGIGFYYLKRLINKKLN